ncbi:hypothetical protein SEA_LOZINAK_72 [Gordonia phage Lozinak]|uniref:Uncharacterized protein n=2 Tax=Smoothievirus smoothie TaxID=1982561 RepID=A0A2D1GFR4_9CAUD|nr:hypothetical protein BEN60_gp134 [Gordonia phage Smoothie]ANA86229.1 hypothetical protein PBI_SMOOTHIE_73 [Gordonia phage Smoothie]ATN90698.1 hypothetical protein SEA_LOZINAK_72 [Gordonia phage Lozinak]
MLFDEEVIPGTYVSENLRETAIFGRCQSRFLVKKGTLHQCDLIYRHAGRHAYLLPSGYPTITWWDDEAQILGALEQEVFNRLVMARDDVARAIEDAEDAVRWAFRKANEANNERLLGLVNECSVHDYYLNDICEFPFDDTESDFAAQLAL